MEYYMKINENTVVYAVLGTLVILLIVPFTVYGQLSGYEVLKTDFYARSSGMGGAFVGVTGDPQAIVYNPAGLNLIKDRLFSMAYFKNVLDINAGNIIFAVPRKTGGVFAVGINYINYGTFEGRDVTGASTADYTANDVVFIAGASRPVSQRFSVGYSGKFLYSIIQNYYSYAVMADGGAVYTFPQQQLTVGISAGNVGTVIDAYSKTKDKLPSVIRGGFSKYLAHLPLMLSAEYRYYLDGGSQVVGGGEFTFNEYFKGRFGYKSYGREQKIGEEGGKTAGASIGCGFKWHQYQFDYSFASFGVIGKLHRLSLCLIF